MTASSARHSRATASAPMLAYSSSATAATMTRPLPRRPDCQPRGGTGHHRRDAALHVLGAASVESSVANVRSKRRGHAVHADGVRVAAQHPRRAVADALSDRDDVDAAWRDLVHADVEPRVAHPLPR